MPAAALAGGNPAVLISIPCDQIPYETTTTFTATGAGDWFSSGNWDNGVPDSATNLVVIPTGGVAQISAPTDAGEYLDVCGGTLDVQSGASLAATGTMLIDNGGTLLLSGSTTVPSTIAINNGALRSTVTGTLSSSLYLGNAGPVTISEAAGQTLTLTGQFENYYGDYNVVFGSASDIGTIIFSPSYLAFGNGPNVAFEIAGGTLKAANDALGSLDPITMTVDAGATLDFNDQQPTQGEILLDLLGAGNVVTGTSSAITLTLGSANFSGGIGGAGNLVVKTECYGEQPTCTSGAVTLSGTNTFTGTTLVWDDGSLTVDGSIADTSGITVDIGGAMTVNGSVTATGAVLVQNDGALTIGSTGSLTTSGAITVNSQSVLTVDGSAAATNGLTVNSGGTLAGTGIVPATQILSGGIIAPGDSGIGTLHVSGGLSVAIGGSYKVDVSSASADKISATGAATLGGTLTLNTISAPAAGTKFTLLTASGGVAGKFVFANTPPPLGEIGPKLVYDANDVILDYELSTLAPDLPVTATSNETSVVTGIDNAIVPGTALPAAFQALAALSSADLATASSQLSGELAADLPAVEASSVDPFLNVLLDQPGTRGAAEPMSQRGRRTGAASVWASGFGEHSDITGDAAGAHDVNASTIGGAVGADVLVMRGLVAGAAVADSHSTFSLGGGMGSGTGDNLEFGIHATAQLGRAAYIAAGGAYALQDVTTRRAITMPSAEVLSAKFTAHDLAGRIEAGWHLRLSRLQLTPYMAAQSQSFDAPAYSEASSGASSSALAYDSATSTNTRVELGAALDGAMKLSRNVNLYLYGSGAWAHALGGNQDAHAAFVALPGSDFAVQGAAAASNLALVTLDAELKGRNGLSFGVKFDGTLSQNSKTYYGTASFSYAW